MTEQKPDALSTQVDGNHYKTLKIQPIQFSVANQLNPIQHSIVKYAVRKKAGIEGRRKDFNKIIHFAQIGLQMLDAGEDV